MPLPLLHQLLLLGLLVAASHGDPSGDHTYDTSMCLLPQNFTCGGVNISYPFYLSNQSRVLDGYGTSKMSCGYPGFGVRCDDDKGPILQLDEAESVVIRSIEGEGANVSLADPDVLDDGNSCPRVDRNVTLRQASWLSIPDGAVDYLVFFLSCSFTTGFTQPPSPYLTTCLGSPDTPSFVFPEYAVPAGNWSQVCKVTRVPVLKYDPNAYAKGWESSGGYAKLVHQGFNLAWNKSQISQPCSRCEQFKGRCGYNETAGFIGCLCPDGRVSSDVCRTKSTGSKNTSIIAGVAAGGGALLVAGLIVIFFLRKKRQRKVTSSSKLLKYSGSGGTPTRSRGGDMESGGTEDLKTHHFSYEELVQATDSFSESREIGDGGFGTVYKGYLGDGRVVAVKRLYNNNYRRVEQFVNEAAILSRLRHPNLVMFYGCTSSHSRELLLVYEFVKNGTVADHLHGHRAAERALTWPLRLSIAVESAAALTYLHAIEQPIVHRDVKTTNILLDTDFHVKVADFGLSRLFPLDVTHVSTAPQGTPGYVDPEYHQCYQLTDKSDVYSFGVVLVELISSKPAVDIARQRNEINLAGMAINKIQKCQLDQLVDLELGYDSDPVTRKMMTMVAELAFRCLQQNGEMRPPIKEVLNVLREIQDGCVVEKDERKDKDLEPPFSPDTVHAPWDSRTTTPNTSQ